MRPPSPDMLACPLCRIVLFADGPCPRDGREGVDAPLRPVPTDVERRFRVLEPFGLGGTGTLYLADDGETGRRGLLKLLRVQDKSRVHRELLRQASLDAQSLARVHVAGESSGVPWLFREWLEGVSLAVRIDRDGPIPVPEAVAIAFAVAEGLDELHRAGLVHRDVKPGHVLLCPRQGSAPRVAILDAGIASPCEGLDTRVLGTPATLSPEVARGEPATFRSDLYALGCVLFHAVSGRAPFPLDDPAAVVAAHRDAPPPVPPGDLPAGLTTLLSSLLAKDPRDRPLSAQQLRRRLRAFLPEDGDAVREPTLAFDLRSHTRGSHVGVGDFGEGPRGTLRPPAVARPPASSTSGVVPAVRSSEASDAPTEAPPRDDATLPLHIEDLEALPGDPVSPGARAPTGGASARWSTPPPAPTSSSPQSWPGASRTGRATATSGVSWSGLTGRFAAPDSQPIPPRDPSESYVPPTPPGMSSRPSRASVRPGVPSSTPPPRPSSWPPPREDAPPAPRVSAPVAGVFPRPRPSRPPEPSPVPSAAHPASAPPSAGPPAAGPRASMGAERLSESRFRVSSAAPFSVPPPSVPPASIPPAAPPRTDPPAPSVAPGPASSPPVLAEGAPAAEEGLWGFLLSRGWLTLAAVALAVFLVGTATIAWTMVQVIAATGWTVHAPAPVASRATSEPMPEPAEAVAEPSTSPVAVADVPAEARGADGETEPAATTPAPSARRDPRPVRRPRASRPPTRREPASPAAAASSKAAPAPRSTASGGSGAFNRARQEGRAHFAGGRYDLAVEAYERATQLSPRHAGSFAGLGAARSAAGDVPGAVRAYERAVQLSPTTSGFHAALGRVRLRAGDRAGAIASYQRALELDANNAAARTALDRLGVR